MAAAPKLRTTNGRGRLFDSVLDTVGDTPCDPGQQSRRRST